MIRRIEGVAAATLLAVIALLATGGAHANESYPRLTGSIGGGLAIPVVEHADEYGGYLTGSFGLRFNEWLRLDALDVHGFISDQVDPDCIAAPCDGIFGLNYVSIGSAARAGWFKEEIGFPRPYVALGLAAGWVDYDGQAVAGSDWDFAVNGGAGMEVALTEQLTGGVLYRFHTMKEEVTDDRIWLHGFAIELSWR